MTNRTLSFKVRKTASIWLLFSIVCTQMQPVQADAQVPSYCGTSGLTEAQETECLQVKNNNSNDQVGNIQLLPSKYPVRIDLLGLNDEYNLNKAVEVNLLANSGDELRIQYRNSDLFILIPSKRIVRWGIGEGNQVDASGAIGMAAGAIFFPPMLLAAPFGIRNVKTNQYQIQFLDQYGSIKSLSLKATMYHRETLSLLRYASGLRPGIPREDAAVKEIEEQTLKDLIKQRDRKAAELVVSNTKKPWCEYLDPKKDDAANTRYRQLSDYVVALSNRLKVAVSPVSVTSSQDEKWKAYLASNPGLKQWSITYPEQVRKLKECPALTG